MSLILNLLPWKSSEELLQIAIPDIFARFVQLDGDEGGLPTLVFNQYLYYGVKVISQFHFY